MKKPTLLLVSLCVCLIGLVCVSAVAVAQPKPSAEAERKEKLLKAKELFVEAERYYKVNEYDVALNKYKEAYLLSGLPDFLFNMGQCYRFLGRYEEAKLSYVRYLRDKPESKAKDQIEIYLAEMEKKQKEQAAVVVPAPEKPSSQESKPIVPLTNQASSAPTTQRDVVPTLPSAPLPRQRTAILLRNQALVTGGLALITAVAAGLRFSEAKQLQEAGTDPFLVPQQQRSAEKLAFSVDLLATASLLSWLGYRYLRP